MKIEANPEQLHQIETGISGKRIWAEDPSSDSLIVFPVSSWQNFHEQFKIRHLKLLDHPPSVTELANHKGGLIVLESDPGKGDPTTTRAYWESQSGPHALGALFPSLKPDIAEYETLIGLLFPNEIKYKGNKSAEMIDPWLKALADTRAWLVSRVLSPREQQMTLDRILAPKTGPVTLAIYGLGDIGSYVAQTLYAQGAQATNIDNLLLVSGNINTSRALEEELRDIKKLQSKPPSIYAVTEEHLDYLEEADVILFLASGYVPPPNVESLKVDVRTVQHGINAQIVRDLVAKMQNYGSDITLLMASDPVEQLTWYAAEQAAPNNRNNQRFAGFGTAINYSRALHQAELMNIDPSLVEVMSTHGKGMIAFIFEKMKDMGLAEKLSLSTALRNYVIRGFNKKPWRAPAQMMTDALIDMFTTGNTFASPFLPSVDGLNPGAFFGTRVFHDLARGTWKPELSRDYDPRLQEIIDRAQQLTSLTSIRPDLLHTDFLGGSIDPDKAIHPAFHEETYNKWFLTADRFARDMNGPYQELADFSRAVVGDILLGIVNQDDASVSQVKSALRERIGITIKRKEGLLDEKIRLLTEGFLGGEVLSGIEYSNLHTAVDMIYRFLRQRERETEKHMFAVFSKRDPPFDSISPDNALRDIPISVKTGDGENIQLQSMEEFEDFLDSINKYPVPDGIPLEDNHLIDKFPLEALKHPHLAVREKAWLFLDNYIYDDRISPELFKKILTLCHFGDDLTLYQWTGDSERDKNDIVFYFLGQIHTLNNLVQKINLSDLKNTDQAVILGTTGAPIGQHHLDILHSGIAALKQRYPRAKAEAFISVDNFSHTKAQQLLAGTIPHLALRRRMAMLQAVNDVNIHLLFPAIPIWFDRENIHLKEQIQREVPNETKIWRLIGGDQLFNYPVTPVYQSLPHIVDMRDQNREVMDAQLNRIHFQEVVQIDTHHAGSSTEIRETLNSGYLPGNLNPLSRAFMKHYGIFNIK